MNRPELCPLRPLRPSAKIRAVLTTGQTAMIRVDLGDFKRLEKSLGAFAKKAGPYASREALNKTAFDARADIQSRIGDQLTERNQFTRRSIRVDRTRSLEITTQKATTGSVAEYFDELEEGQRKTPKSGSKSVPLATAYAAGQRGIRTRMPTRRNAMRNLTLRQKALVAKNPKQRNVLLVQDAVNSGRRLLYLELGKTKGIFRVVGGKAHATKRGWPRGARLKMIYNLSKTSTPRPKQAIFAGMARDIGPVLERNYQRAIDFQLKRLGWL